MSIVVIPFDGRVLVRVVQPFQRVPVMPRAIAESDL